MTLRGPSVKVLTPQSREEQLNDFQKKMQLLERYYSSLGGIPWEKIPIRERMFISRKSGVIHDFPNPGSGYYGKRPLRPLIEESIGIDPKFNSPLGPLTMEERKKRLK